MAFDPSTTLSQFLGSMPTFVAVLLAWMHSNGRIADVNGRISDVHKRIDDLRDIIRAEGAATRSELRSELRRVEEVMDARLKHLEERER
jgi:hypothetical protein